MAIATTSATEKAATTSDNMSRTAQPVVPKEKPAPMTFTDFASI